jgi:dihydrofolate reductase
MGHVVWHFTMSLDGFIAGPDDDMEWAFESFRGQPRNDVGEEVMKSTGAILAGRRWYDGAAPKYDGVAGIYGGRWQGPVFVITHRPDGVPDDPSVTFLSDGIESAVGTGLEAAGGKNLEIFGANTAQQVLSAGLLDEIVAHVAPVLLGDGVRLYGQPGAPTVRLQRTALAGSGKVADMRFKVRLD